MYNWDRFTEFNIKSYDGIEVEVKLEEDSVNILLLLKFLGSAVLLFWGKKGLDTFKPIVKKTSCEDGVFYIQGEQKVSKKIKAYKKF